MMLTFLWTNYKTF